MNRSELKQIIREVIEESRVVTKSPNPLFRLNSKGERLFDSDNMEVVGTLIGFAIMNLKDGYALDNETGEIWDLDSIKLKNPKISAVRNLPIYSFKYEEFEPGFPMFDDLKEAELAAKNEGEYFGVFEIRRLSKSYEKNLRTFKWFWRDWLRRYNEWNWTSLSRWKGDDYKNQGLSYYQELIDFAEEIQPGAGIPWIQWILETVR